MAATGIGLDLLEIDRLERALTRRPRLAERVFTDEERAYAARRARPATHLAARFCAKEATAKALGLSGWRFQDVEVVASRAGPWLRLRGRVALEAERLGVVPVVSLTHERSVAAAAVILAPAGEAPASEGDEA